MFCCREAPACLRRPDGVGGELQDGSPVLEEGHPWRPNYSPLSVFNLFLLQQNSEGRTVVLIIDEAQNLEAPVLEQIRLISNLETDREKLIQIVLSGQPELAQILKKNEMRQLSQRIVVRYHLQPWISRTRYSTSTIGSKWPGKKWVHLF